MPNSNEPTPIRAIKEDQRNVFPHGMPGKLGRVNNRAAAACCDTHLFTLMQRAICFCSLASAKLPPRLYALHESAVLCTRKGAASLACLATAACAGLVLAKEAMVTHGYSGSVPMGVVPEVYNGERVGRGFWGIGNACTRHILICS